MINLDQIRKRAEAKAGTRTPMIALDDEQVFPLNPTITIMQQDLMTAGDILGFLESCCPPETWAAVKDALQSLPLQAAEDVALGIISEYGLDPKKPRRR